MAVDEGLLQHAVDHDVITLRFYQWNAPTLSLGYFQRLTDRNGHQASLGVPVVRRPTGGGALVHDVELTYSLVLPPHHGQAASPRRLYELVHGELITMLGELGIRATFSGDAPSVRDGGSRRREPFLCFERRAPVDVLIDGAKIAGSAQRRVRGAVLQHGSVLLARSTAAPELPGILELTGTSLAPDSLARRWGRHLAHRLAMRFEPALPDPRFRQWAEQRVTERYASPAWTKRR